MDRYSLCCFSPPEIHPIGRKLRMPKCPVCKKQVSVFQWDLFGRRCTACVRIDPHALDGLLSDPCPECGSCEIFATTAPALAFVQTKNGPVPSKVAPGLFIIGCSDCGCAYFKFNQEGAAALPDTPGWLGRDQLQKRDNHEVHCPSCAALLNLAVPSGIRIAEDESGRIYCETCNQEISDLI
jgi:predicted  nucleic acid-binding Zn-ribbon protein